MLCSYKWCDLVWSGLVRCSVWCGVVCAVVLVCGVVLVCSVMWLGVVWSGKV